MCLEKCDEEKRSGNSRRWNAAQAAASSSELSSCSFLDAGRPAAVHVCVLLPSTSQQQPNQNEERLPFPSGQRIGNDLIDQCLAVSADCRFQPPTSSSIFLSFFPSSLCLLLSPSDKRLVGKFGTEGQEEMSLFQRRNNFSSSFNSDILPSFSVRRSTAVPLLAFTDGDFTQKSPTLQLEENIDACLDYFLWPLLKIHKLCFKMCLQRRVNTSEREDGGSPEGFTSQTSLTFFLANQKTGSVYRELRNAWRLSSDNSEQARGQS